MWDIVRSARLPLAVAGLVLASVLVLASLYGYSPLDSSTWARWDSGNYLDIARDGYDLFPCQDEPDTWCGDAAWFPGYPWLVGGLHLTGLPLRPTGVVVAWLFAAGTLVLLWFTFLQRRTNSAVVAALFYAALNPGQIYYYAVFPLSLLTFATVGSLWLVYRRRYVFAGLAGAVATLAYPLGVLIAPVSAIWLLLQRRRPLGDRLVAAATVGGLVLAGFWILVLDQALETGRWDAFFLVQQKYAGLRASHNPFVVTWDLVRNAAVHAAPGLGFVIGLQTALVTLVLAVLVVAAFVRRTPLASVDALLLGWALATWALGLSQSLSIQRGQAALLPVAVLVARLPAPLAWVFAVAAAGVAFWLEKYFLDASLV